MNEAPVVADASAVIALLIGEAFTLFDPQRLVNASISAVNLSEVLARLLEIGMPEDGLDRAAKIVVEHPYYNPRRVEYEGIRHLLENAYRGKLAP